MHKGYQVGLLLLFLGFCAVFFNYWPKTSEQWASWVQAVGSIAAIGVAIAVARDQASKQRQLFIDEAKAAERAQLERRIEAVQAAGAILSHTTAGLRKGCIELRRALTHGKIIQFSNGPALRLRDSVSRIPLYESPYCIFATEIAMCAHQIETFIDVASAMSSVRPGCATASDLQKLEEVEDAAIHITILVLEKADSYDGTSPMLSPRAKQE